MQESNSIDNITVLYDDPTFFVINKPAGIVVNRSDSQRNNITVQDLAAKYINRLDAPAESEFVRRGGIVHRLDKQTSGAMIIAKNQEAFYALQSQFKEKIVKKTYLALCHGRLAPMRGEVNVPIGRLPWNRMRFGVIASGRQSVTLYSVSQYKKIAYDHKNSEVLSLVEAYPQTGRTHQIRVHFQYLGHPIFADELYGGRKTIKKDLTFLSRHFLHASMISFNHPVSKKQITVEAPLDDELSAFLSSLDSA